MEECTTQIEKSVVLDRIDTITTMMCELFWMWDEGYPAHEGLTEVAAYHIQQAMDELSKARHCQKQHVQEEK